MSFVVVSIFDRFFLLSFVSVSRTTLYVLFYSTLYCLVLYFYFTSFVVPTTVVSSRPSTVLTAHRLSTYTVVYVMYCGGVPPGTSTTHRKKPLRYSTVPATPSIHHLQRRTRDTLFSGFSFRETVFFICIDRYGHYSSQLNN